VKKKFNHNHSIDIVVETCEFPALEAFGDENGEVVVTFSGTYHRAVRETRDDPGEPATFEVSNVVLFNRKDKLPDAVQENLTEEFQARLDEEAAESEDDEPDYDDYYAQDYRGDDV
jgi:hypothetical protein